MKRFSLVLAILAISITVVFGQRPRLNKVESMLKSDEIADAKAMIDQAVDYEKTKDEPETYYLRGLVYTVIDTSSTYSDLAENPMEVALASYQRAQEMNDSDKELFIMDNSGFPVTITQHIQTYWTHYFNKGARAYGSENYEDAVASFKLAQQILPEDTNAYVNAGLAAQNMEDFETARDNYYKAIERGVKAKDIHNLLIYIVGSQENNPEEALRLTRAIKEEYPEDNDLARSEISLLIQMERVEEAQGNLEKQIEAEPDDPNLHFTQALLFEELAAKEEDIEAKEALVNKAMAAYRRAVEIDPEHYNSQYNIGVMLISAANEVIKESNNLGVSKEDLQKADELAPIIENKLKEALPQWETIRSLKGDDVPTLETLQYLYTQLKMYEKAEEVMAKIDELKEG